MTIDPEEQPYSSPTGRIASLRSSWRARGRADDARFAAQSLPRFALRAGLPWLSGTVCSLDVLRDWGGRDWKIGLVVLWLVATLDLVRTAVRRHRARARLAVFPVRGPDG